MQNPNVLVTVAGLAGTPKHEVADAIAREAQPFDQAPRISAGDYFRTAAWLAIESADHGSPIHRFYGGHDSLIRAYLADNANRAFLYEDPEIEKQVSDISARVSGVEELCHRMFVKDVTLAYRREGRSLIVADALHPIEHLRRASAIGDESWRIAPRNVLPIFVDTSPAATGHLADGNTYIAADQARLRRQIDARRPQAQVRPPSDPMNEIGKWEAQFNPDTPPAEPVLPLRFKYNPDTSPTDISEFAASIVGIAQAVSSRSELANQR